MLELLSRRAVQMPTWRRGRIGVPHILGASRILGVWCLLLALPTLFLLAGVAHTYAAPLTQGLPFFQLQRVADDFEFPIDVVSPDDGSNRLFVVERGGRIFIVQNGIRLEDAFLDISGSVSGCPECGLLGLAFPPDFAEKGYFFVNYTADTDLVPPDTGDADPTDIGDTVIARFRVSDKPNVADEDSEEPILVINQPAGNHNGGHIFFGPDNHLYIGMGDGGGEGDTFQNAQDPASLHGKILRIGVSDTATYTIPADNPFVEVEGYRPEIWAMGLRNPWRFHFDEVTGDLYVADVGQENFEEVNHVPAAEIGDGGLNFGWPIFEGNVCFPPNGPQSCDATGMTMPVATYDHFEGCSVTGGYIYRAQKPFQSATYLYGDFCTGKIWGLSTAGDTPTAVLLKESGFMISSFGQDEAGNFYLLEYAAEDGVLYRVVDGEHFQRLPALANDD